MGLRHLSGVELIEYADGETPVSKRVRVEAHLQTCTRCAAAVAKVQSAASAVGALGAAPVPDDLRERVAERVRTGHAPEVSCRRALPLIHQRLDGCMLPADEAVLEQHLSGCGLCRAELAGLAAAKRLVGALPGVESPAGVREAVVAARRERAREMPWTARWVPALAAASVVMIGVLGLVLATRQAGQSPESVVVARDVMSAPVAPVAVAERSTRLEETGSGADIGDSETGVAAGLLVLGRREAEEHAIVEAPAGVHLVRGPTPAPTGVEAAEPEVLLPSGLHAVRAVARSASHGHDVRVAMELVGEQFATLDSERVLAQLPGRLDADGGEEPGLASDGPEFEAPADEETEESEDRSSDSAWAPMNRLGSGSSGPLV